MTPGDDEDEGGGGPVIIDPRRADPMTEFNEIAALMDEAITRLMDCADAGFSNDALTRLEEARFWLTRAGAVPREH